MRNRWFLGMIHSRFQPCSYSGLQLNTAALALNSKRARGVRLGRQARWQVGRKVGGRKMKEVVVQDGCKASAVSCGSRLLESIPLPGEEVLFRSENLFALSESKAMLYSLSDSFPQSVLTLIASQH